MKPQFTAEFFRQNRAKLRELFTGRAPIVLTANGLLQRNGDNTYPFRQDSSFWYLTGIDEPNVTLVMDRAKEYLIVPEREAARETFDGAINPEHLTARSGIEVIVGEKDGWKQLTTRLKKVRHVATLAALPSFVEGYGLYTNPARARLLARMKEISDEIELLDLRTHLTKMRAIKQPVELEALQYAIDLTVDVIKQIYRKRDKYEHEYEIEADITAFFGKHGGLGHSFSPVVASGKNACTAHYFANKAPVDQKGLLLLDIGAEAENYAADIARTFPIGTPSRRQQDVMAATLEIHEYAKGLLRPGVIPREYETKVDQMMGEKLRELGLIKVIDKEAVRKYYPQLTSHFLGLDAHDTGEYDQPLKPGMVLTVEPAMYIPQEGIGVRVEDDILITEDGIRVLSERLPTFW